MPLTRLLIRRIGRPDLSSPVSITKRINEPAATSTEATTFTSQSQGVKLLFTQLTVDFDCPIRVNIGIFESPPSPQVTRES